MVVQKRHDCRFGALIEFSILFGVSYVEKGKLDTEPSGHISSRVDFYDIMLMVSGIISSS